MSDRDLTLEEAIDQYPDECKAISSVVLWEIMHTPDLFGYMKLACLDTLMGDALRWLAGKAITNHTRFEMATRTEDYRLELRWLKTPLRGLLEEVRAHLHKKGREMREVTITVRGEPKVGKTTLIALIVKTLNAAGIHAVNAEATIHDDTVQIAKLCNDEEKLGDSLAVVAERTKVVLKEEQG